MDDPQYQFIAEQLGRMKDNIEWRFQLIEADAWHEKELAAARAQAATKAAEINAKAIEDHETRIRLVSDAVTSLKTTGSLISAAQAALTRIAVAVAAWLGGNRSW